MKTLAVVDRFNQRTAPSHFVPLMLHMAPETVIFYCGADYLENFPDEIFKIKERGIKIVVDAYEGIGQHDYLLSDDSMWAEYQAELRSSTHVSEKNRGWLYQRYAKKSARIIFYSHSVDDGPSDCNMPSNSFGLHPYEWSFLKDTGEGTFMCDKEGRALVSRSAKSNERVVIGFTHMAGMKIPENPAEKKALKNSLAAKMGVTFNPDLPLVVFTYAPMDTDEACLGVERLSKAANIVIKNFQNHAYLGKFDRSLDVTGPNIFHSTDNSLNSLMRLAADVNFTSFISSAFVSCVAHGLRTVPICTQMMSSAVPRGIFAYSFYMAFLSKAYARLTQCIGPINISFTDKLAARIVDNEYWTEYESKLPAVQKYIFGNYQTGDYAAKIGANHIMNVLRWGSFVTPELKHNGQAFNGRGDLNPPMPLVGL